MVKRKQNENYTQISRGFEPEREKKGCKMSKLRTATTSINLIF